MKQEIYKIYKTVILKGSILFMLLVVAKNALAVSLILDYPNIGGSDIEETTTIPGVIRYIYLFSIGIAGITALLSIIIGAFQYVTSAGSPDKVKDAKDRIFSAIIGVIILLASVLILRTINPDLVSLSNI
ncbi:MAG: hypothetical protein A2V69_01230 [Candidatus Portnoybacteria bacterium RBG_13_40_8]|uniref:Uncharacterized protein n=1 Tax=Candidatus Portnoybacteria bacterium RBG_13_40_8 TaxID=1801990 RepID=A0A1G2F3F1_9BACT|nr:MAG: hypothetical protein A2V69_01230 [Candidatus Portnoybacteria bacterium RBG_13_40_8]OGZ34833.1 MAG: hypothetical protein A2V60_00795 [Candidatus Portnoybacteria bacterium RIFCSPHIGHO2_01_FULL_39_19]